MQDRIVEWRREAGIAACLQLQTELALLKSFAL